MPLFQLDTVEPVTRGDYEEIRFELTEPDPVDPDNPGPQNITGWTLRFGAKFDLSDTTYVVTKTSADPTQIRVDDATNGVGHIILQPPDLQDVTYETTLICDLEASDAAGKPFTTRFRLPVEMDVST